MAHIINAQQLKTWLDNHEAVLIDVREPSEYVAEHIEGSISLPLSQLSKKSLTPYQQHGKIVFQCHAGRRSQTACDNVADAVTSSIHYSLDGGISAWKNAGYKTMKSGQFFLPLDRQVQLAIGLCVLIGSILAYIASPAFLLLTGFFGTGLTFAGLTGFCGLAMLLARMPWNQKPQTLGHSP